MKNKLTKKEKDENVEVPKPIKKQFIANDITLEALVFAFSNIVTL